MTKVLILSDSHGLTNEISDITNRHQTDHIIHCGDSELELDHPVLKDMIIVKGNCDYHSGFRHVQKLEIDGLNFFITHGHLYDVGSDLLDLYEDANLSGANVVCYGHTHVAHAEKIKNILFLNPGSIRLPRQRNIKTYAIMKWNHIKNIQVEFYTESGKKIDELSFNTSLE